MMFNTVKVAVPCGDELHNICMPAGGSLRIYRHKDRELCQREERFVALGGRRSLCRQILDRSHVLQNAARYSVYLKYYAPVGHMLRVDYAMWWLLQWLAGNEEPRELLFGSTLELAKRAGLMANQAQATDNHFNKFMELRCQPESAPTSATPLPAAESSM